MLKMSIGVVQRLAHFWVCVLVPGYLASRFQ
jgi:hypothetical protein